MRFAIQAFAIVALLLWGNAPATGKLEPASEGRRKVAASPDPSGGTGGGAVAGSLLVTVISARDGLPLPGVFIMVGEAFGVPFPGNTTFTDATGRARISHPTLTGPYTLTVAASGYVWFTLVGAAAAEVVVPLEPLYDPHPPSISGNVRGASLPRRSNRFYAAAAFPTLDIEMALFPTDALLMMWHYAEFPVLVQTGAFVPGNLTIPPGQIYHSLDYRLPVADLPQNVEITAIGGSIALSQYLPIAAAYAESRDFHTYLLDLFEAFRYEQIGTANFSVDGDTAGGNVPLTHASSKTIEASVRNHPPFDTFVMGMMHDPGSRRFLPTGFATVCHRQDSACHAPGNTVTVRVPATSATQEYQGLRHGAVAVSGNLSGTFQQGTAILRRNVGRYGTPLFEDFLALPSPMRIEGDRFTWSDARNEAIVPQSPAPDLHRCRFMKFVAEEEVDPETGLAPKYEFPVWEIYAPGDRLSFTLPHLPTSEEAGGEVPPTPLTESYREILYWIVESAALTEGEPFDFDAWDFASFSSRVTHIAKDFILFPISYPDGASLR